MKKALISMKSVLFLMSSKVLMLFFLRKEYSAAAF